MKLQKQNIQNLHFFDPRFISTNISFLSSTMKRKDWTVKFLSDKIFPSQLFVVVAALLGLGASRLLIGLSKPRQILEDHPMCGITTGGQVRLETSICFLHLELYFE